MYVASCGLYLKQCAGFDNRSIQISNEESVRAGYICVYLIQ